MKYCLPFLCLFCYHEIAAQYTNLVMEGSGIKAFAYVGALMTLDEENKLQDVERIGGTSGGSIIACLYAIGYTPAEMEKIAYDVPLSKFTDRGFIWQKNRASINKTFGIYKGDAFEHWLEKLVVAKTGNKDITFEQLYQQRVKKNIKNYISLPQIYQIRKALP